MLTLPELLEHLASVYGAPEPPPDRSLFELVLWDNVAYLADDAARSRAFSTLAAHIGLRPDQLLAASDEDLQAITGHGILAASQAAKLREIARIAMDDDVEAVGALPLPKAKRALMRYPSIGEPGAEKILLFARLHPVLGLESNGVRVLTRVGLVAEARSYSATYREVQRLGAYYAERGCAWLIGAHQLLRQHGQTLCRRSRPLCERCPLTAACAFYARGLPGLS